ncbi:MAG: ABC transporter ATP-binding protein [Desulfobulbus propionicus]|nr:MAG: ABC transporter ATP-binding protein [Desulfobulbus propionicus]
MHKDACAEEPESATADDASLWRRIAGYCRKYAYFLAGAVLLSFIVTIAGLLLPKLVQLGIDGFITQETLSGQERIQGVRNAALLYLLLAGVVFLCRFVQTLLLEWTGQSIMDLLRQELFGHILSLDMRFFHDQQSGRLATRVTNDIQNLHEMFTMVLVTLFNEALKLLGILCFLYAMNVRLALIMSLFLPVSILMTIYFSRLSRKRFRLIRAQLATINGFLTETFAAVHIIQIFNRQKSAEERHRKMTSEYFKRNMSQVKLFGVFMPLTDVLSSFAVALLLWYGGGEVIRQRLTLGELTAFLTYMRMFFQPLREFSQMYTVVQSAMASAERIFNLLDTRSSLPEVHDEHPSFLQGGDICFQAISFCYSEDAPVLKNIQLLVREGESVAIVGATGSGKSTLIKLLSRFYDPDCGSITIGGIDIRNVPLSDLRRHVGVIMQDTFILPDTVLANIILDLEPDPERLETILADTGLIRFVERLPQGMKTVVGEGGLELSVGEKQMLSFVRAMYRNSRILILDEATASIDAESEKMLEQAVMNGSTHHTSIIIAHRLSSIRRVDRIVVLEQGEIVEQGTHEELIKKGMVYRQLVDLDAAPES